jgi:hypothetical protein
MYEGLEKVDCRSVECDALKEMLRLKNKIIASNAAPSTRLPNLPPHPHESTHLRLQYLKQILDKFNHVTPLNLVACALFSQTKLFDSNRIVGDFLLADHDSQRGTNLFSLFELFGDVLGLLLVLKFRLPINHEHP